MSFRTALQTLSRATASAAPSSAAARTFSSSSLRLLSSPSTSTASPRTRPAARQLHVSASLSKKAAKHQDAFEEEFEEDTFEDDIDADLPSSDLPSSGVGASRADRYAAALARVKKTLSHSSHHLSLHKPSQREIVAVIRQAAPENLDETLKVLAKWRTRGLEPLSPKNVALLARRLGDAAKEDGGAQGVEVLTNRTKFGVDLPTDLAPLYPLFASLSGPQPSSSTFSSATPVEGATEPAEAAEQEALTSADSPSSSVPSASPSAVDRAFNLYSTVLLHQPSASSNVVLLLSTLAAAARAGELSRPRVAELISAAQAAGEDALVQQTQTLPRKWRDLVRMRSRAVALALREKEGEESEFFAHLFERLQLAEAQK